MKRSIIPLMLILLILPAVHGAEITQEDPFGFNRIPDSNTTNFQMAIDLQLIKAKLNELPTTENFKSFEGSINSRFNSFEEIFIPMILVITLAVTLLQTLFFIMLKAFGKW